jgi:hypothetical protein
MNQIDQHPATLLMPPKAAQNMLRQGTFIARAKECALRYLREHGPTSGEDLTDVCKAAGIFPDPGRDDRDFGQVYQGLSNDKLITKVPGVDVPRRRGHRTSGGNLWKVVQQ